jgi:hypothetical protein
MVFSAVAIAACDQSVAWAEEDEKKPEMVEIEAIDEWGDLVAMSLIDVVHKERKKAPCIVWDRAHRRVVWRQDGVAFPHFVTEGKQVLGIRAGRILVWHDTKTGKELRRRQIALPKGWERAEDDDVWWNQAKTLSLLADKKEVIVTVHQKLFRHRLADGKTFFQPESEKTYIDAKDGTTTLQPVTVRAAIGEQDRFVAMVYRMLNPPFDSDRESEGSVDFVLWDARTLRSIRRWRTKDGDFPRATAISADGRFVAGIVERNGEVGEKDISWCIIWDTKTGKAVHDPLWKANTFKLTWAGYRALAFSNDSKLLASLTGVDQVGVFDVKTGRRIETLKLPDFGIKDRHDRPTPSIVQFSADGQRLYVGTINGGLFIWDQPGKQPADNRKPSQAIPLSKLLK